MADTIIIGAGIAGLTVALAAIKHNPKSRVLILEAYDYVGGRIVTYHKAPNQWEIGAGRIATTHTKVRALMKRYDLTWRPLGGPSEPTAFAALAPIYLDTLRRLSPTILGTHTISELLIKIHGPRTAKAFASLFPYWAEIHRLRADLALTSFAAEMSPAASFGVCAEGLDQIPKQMAAEFTALGGEIWLNTPVKDIKGQTVHLGRSATLERESQKGRELLGKGRTISAPRIILALHADAIANLPSIRWAPARHLRMDPLVRMYAVFPTKPTTWFSAADRIVVPGRVRYVIPIDVKKGSIMISYTDGADARYWMARHATHGLASIQTEVMRYIRTLFPTRHIPDPVLFKVYPWHSGCTYWLPGAYDVAAASREGHVIHDGLYVCGESVSLRQAWIEGALESAEYLCGLLGLTK